MADLLPKQNEEAYIGDGIPAGPTEAQTPALNTPTRSLAEAEADILRLALERIADICAAAPGPLGNIATTALSKASELRGNGR